MDNEKFHREAYEALHDILSFWATRMADCAGGGFFGRIDGHGTLHPEAARGAVLNARILWAFSAAYRTTHKSEYLEAAMRARDYFVGHFIDTEFGGVYWSVDADGRPLDTRKQIYALGFAIYGLSEFARATGDAESADIACRLFEEIERRSFDPKRNGYFEAFTREWKAADDMRLSEKDANECKTMNTHLHIIEPYTNLYRIWPDVGLHERIENLLNIFAERIYDPATGHLGLFFDEEWRRRDAACSYGHDIEASWLLLDAAQTIGAYCEGDIMHLCRSVADAAAEGLQEDGSMIYERHADGTVDADRHWWVQAENTVGQLWLWCCHGDETAYLRAEKCWGYIKSQIIDLSGEWLWARHADGMPDRLNDLAGFWKCPYHNVRMCLEVMRLTT